MIDNETIPIVATGLNGLVGGAVQVATKGEFSWRNLGVDITDPSAVEASIRNSDEEVVVNFAAFTNVGEAWKQQGDKGASCYRLNVEGPANVARSCERHGKFLVHVSTDYVYRGLRNVVYTEQDPVDAVDWYGYTKGLSENVVLNRSSENAILRISSPFSSRMHQKSPDIVAKITDKIRTGTLPPQFADTLFIPTWVDEFAGVIRETILLRLGGIFNAVGSTAISPYDFSLIVADTYGLETTGISEGSLAEYQKTNDRPYAPYLNLSNEKVRRVMGVFFSDATTALAKVFEQQTGYGDQELS